MLTILYITGEYGKFSTCNEITVGQNEYPDAFIILIRKYSAPYLAQIAFIKEKKVLSEKLNLESYIRTRNAVINSKA